MPRAEADTWTDAAQTLGVWMSTMLTSAAAVCFRHRCDRPDFLLSWPWAAGSASPAGPQDWP
ncbi:hypothetical protein [Streptomyces sp. KL116D]|uniref:hypothetical protein n=1 Tax=Streptomyces sp. KL116D TaxID=3045152 RepID=UPI003555E899